MAYSDAVKLYEKVGTNSALKRLFAEGEDDYSIKKLRKEFETILIGLQGNSSQNAFKTYATPKNSTEYLQIDQFPEALRIEYAKVRDLISELRHEHPKLKLYATKQERFEACARMYRVIKERRKIWDRVDYFKEHGVEHPMYQVHENVVAEAEKQKVTLYEAKYKLNLLRSQRTKLKDKPNRYDDLMQVKKEIAELEDLIRG